MIKGEMQLGTRIAGSRSGGSPVAGQRGLPALPAQSQWPCVPLLFPLWAENAQQWLSPSNGSDKTRTQIKGQSWRSDASVHRREACLPLDADGSVGAQSVLTIPSTFSKMTAGWLGR